MLQDDAGGEPLGSEYMASSIVRGCPDECLSVLVDLSSNTTILGPASKIELLEDGEERQVGGHGSTLCMCSKGCQRQQRQCLLQEYCSKNLPTNNSETCVASYGYSADDSTFAAVSTVLLLSCCCLQVLRLTVEATGMARRLCAPREVIVERLFKRWDIWRSNIGCITLSSTPS
jgi:hypothetical protein